MDGELAYEHGYFDTHSAVHVYAQCLPWLDGAGAGNGVTGDGLHHVVVPVRPVQELDTNFQSASYYLRFPPRNGHPGVRQTTYGFTAFCW